jgi:hypothetical protein
VEADPSGQPTEPADDQRGVGVAGQAQRHVQRVHAGPAAAPRHEEGPGVGDRPATGLERAPGGGVRHPIAAGLPGRQVGPVVAGPEEELHQQTPQRPQEPQQRRLELEEGRGPLVHQAVRDDLVEPLAGLALQVLDGRWTVRGGRITLAIAHGDRLLTVPDRDIFSGQDKSPEHPRSAAGGE